ncbi:hypothetical protein NUM3379_00320 [Kineococcus sp. NUM-3379]
MQHARVAAAAVLGTVLACAGATSAPAAPPGSVPPAAVTSHTALLRCGDVVTASVRLAADLVCPDGRGLTVAADGVDVNLNGHTLTGAGTDGDWEEHVGIRVDAEDVTIRNGRLRNWGVGVRAGVVDGPETPVASAVLRGLLLEGNRWGAVAHPGAALALDRSRLVGNLVTGAAMWGGTLRVENSTADRNGNGFLVFGAAPRQEAFVLRDSRVLRSGEAGVSCFTSAGTILIERSLLQRNQFGYDDYGCRWWTVRDSVFQWNTWHVAGDLFAPNYTIECTTFLPRSRPIDLPVLPCA